MCSSAGCSSVDCMQREANLTHGWGDAAAICLGRGCFVGIHSFTTCHRMRARKVCPQLEAVSFIRKPKLYEYTSSERKISSLNMHFRRQPYIAEACIYTLNRWLSSPSKSNSPQCCCASYWRNCCQLFLIVHRQLVDDFPEATPWWRGKQANECCQWISPLWCSSRSSLECPQANLRI